MAREHFDETANLAGEAVPIVFKLTFTLSGRRSALRCRPKSEAIEAYVLKRMSREEEDSFEEHLFFCEACRSEVAKLDDLRAVLQLLREQGKLAF